MERVAVEALQDGEDFGKFSLENQDADATFRDDAFRIGSSRHFSEHFFGNAEVAFPIYGEFRFHAAQAEGTRRQLNSVVKGLAGRFKISDCGVVDSKVLQDPYIFRINRR